VGIRHHAASEQRENEMSGGFYTTGSWRSVPGKEADFVRGWRALAGWAAGLEGCAGPASLPRDLRDEGRSVSFVEWDSLDAIRGWKTHPEFMERMIRVQEFVDTFAPTELEVVERA
jgi:heme-degrading monooxygenase HmoA